LLPKGISQADFAQVEYEASLESYQAALESSLQPDEKFRQGMINSVELTGY
jgi:hypothetical protein